MRRWRGRRRDRKLETKDRTEERELRSSGRTMISEHGNSAETRAFISSAVLRLRAGSTSLAPRLARTLAVSAPMPDVAPVITAVIRWRSGDAAVTASAVDFEPKLLGPTDPIKYLTVSSISSPSSSFSSSIYTAIFLDLLFSSFSGESFGRGEEGTLWCQQSRIGERRRTDLYLKLHGEREREREGRRGGRKFWRIIFSVNWLGDKVGGSVRWGVRELLLIVNCTCFQFDYGFVSFTVAF